MAETEKPPQTAGPNALVPHSQPPVSPGTEQISNEFLTEVQQNSARNMIVVYQKGGRMQPAILTKTTNENYIVEGLKYPKTLWTLAVALIPNPYKKAGNGQNPRENLKRAREKKAAAPRIDYEAITNKILGSELTGMASPIGVTKPKSGGFCPICLRLLELCECAESSIRGEI